MRKITLQPSSENERRFAKIKLLLDGLGELACNPKAFQPTIPDSQGQNPLLLTPYC